MTTNPKARSNYFCCAAISGNATILTSAYELKDVPCPYQQFAPAMLDSCILTNFQPDELFFYEIVEYKSDKKEPDNELQIERGIGCLLLENQTYSLDRLTPLSSIDGPITRHVEFSPNKKLFLQTYIPKDYRELFSTPNTILSTEVAGCPSIVELQDNTLLGRLNSTIQSIDKNEIHDILGDDFISVAINRNDKDLSSPSSKFTLTGKDSIVTANSIRLNPQKRRPSKKIKGQVIYNDKTNSLEYWTGRQWRTIVSQ